MKNIVERVMPDQDDEEYENHLERYKFAGQFVKDKIVLDVACGVGYGSHELLENGAKKVIGIDIFSEAIDYAKKHYQGHNLVFQIGSAENLSLTDESVDLVISFETIEHLKDYSRFLSELHRVLKPGGILIISTPNRMAVLRNIFSCLFFKRPINRYHCIEFSKKQFKSLLEQYFIDIKFFGQRELPKKTLFYFIKRCFNLININVDSTTKIIPYPIEKDKTVANFIVLCKKQYV